MPREFIERHQRARIISALADTVAEKGFRATTVADIVRRAGIARNTFYENFSSKEDCFLAALEFALNEGMRRTSEAALRYEDWPRQVNAGLGALLEYAAAEPSLSRTCLIEAMAAGDASVQCYEQAIQTFVPLLRMGRESSEDGERLPATLEESLVGGGFWLVYQRLVSGNLSEIPNLRPELAEFVLTPYIGSEAAAKVARAPESADS